MVGTDPKAAGFDAHKGRVSVNWRAFARDCAEGKMTDERLIMVLKTHPYTTSYVMGEASRPDQRRPVGARVWFSALWRDYNDEESFKRKHAARTTFYLLDKYEETMSDLRDLGFIVPKQLPSGRKVYVPSPKGVLGAGILSGYTGQCCEQAREMVAELDAQGIEVDPKYAAERKRDMKVMELLSEVCQATGTHVWEEALTTEVVRDLIGGTDVDDVGISTLHGWPPRDGHHGPRNYY